MKTDDMPFQPVDEVLGQKKEESVINEKEDFYERHKGKLEEVIDDLIGVLKDNIRDIPLMDKPHLAISAAAQVGSTIATLERVLMVVASSKGGNEEDVKHLEEEARKTMQQAANVIKMSTARLNKKVGAKK